MVQSIRAIPKTYRGEKFRSTLEADWAYNLDRLSIAWQYEPEAVLLPSGEEYRPDFYLPELTTWFEVKGPHDARLHKTRELAEASWHTSDCPGYSPEVKWVMFGKPWSGYSSEDRIAKAVAELPDGPTQLFIEHRTCPEEQQDFSWPLGNYVSDIDRSAFIQRIKVKRKVSLPRADCSYCGHGWGNPWRATFIGRPSSSGTIRLEPGSTQHHAADLLRCYSCTRWNVQVPHGRWICRLCGVKDESSQHCGYNYPGYTQDGPFYGRQAMNLPFLRLPSTSKEPADPSPQGQPVVVSVPKDRYTTAVEERVHWVLSSHPGLTEVWVRLVMGMGPGESPYVTTLTHPLRVTADAAFTTDLKALLGPRCLD